MVGCEAKAIGEYCETLIFRSVIPRNRPTVMGQNNVRYLTRERSMPILSFWEFLKIFAGSLSFLLVLHRPFFQTELFSYLFLNQCIVFSLGPEFP